MARDKPAFGLSEALILAAIPGIAFAIVAVFQAGYLAYFGIPLGASSLDAASAFGVLGGMFRVGVSTLPGLILLASILAICIPSIPYILSLERTDRTLKRIPGSLIAIGLCCFAATPFIWAPFIVPIPAVLYVIYLLRTDDTYTVPPNATHIDMWFPLGVFRMIIVGLLAVPCAFFAGYMLAEIGPNGNSIREVAAIEAGGVKRFFLIALVRPENALGIEIYRMSGVRKDGSVAWSFVPAKSRQSKIPAAGPVSFIVFEKPLSGGVRQCDSPARISDANQAWVYYAAINAGTATLALKCDESNIPVSKLGKAE